MSLNLLNIYTIDNIHRASIDLTSAWKVISLLNVSMKMSLRQLLKLLIRCFFIMLKIICHTKHFSLIYSILSSCNHSTFVCNYFTFVWKYLINWTYTLNSHIMLNNSIATMVLGGRDLWFRRSGSWWWRKDGGNVSVRIRRIQLYEEALARSYR